MSSEWNGYSLRYRSAFTGSSCVCLVTSSSENVKTGPMAQVYFLHAGEAPHVAQAAGHDFRVCGDCKLRPVVGGCCYVVTCNGPNAAWKAWRAGRYKVGLEPVGVPVRYGAYGDPASMSPRMFKRLHAALGAPSWTGYTHAWRDRPDLQPYLMASVDSEEEAVEARSLGWRYFRVKRAEHAWLPGESWCPAQARKPHVQVQCIDCGFCNGLERSRSTRSVVINVHGSKAGRF